MPLIPPWAQAALFLIPAVREFFASPAGAGLYNFLFVAPANQLASDKLSLEQRGDLANALTALDKLDALPDEIRQVIGPVLQEAKEFLNPQASDARFDRALGPVVKGLDALPGNFQQGAADVNRFGADRTTQGLALLEGAGEQTRRDINQQFDELGGTIAQNLTSRGLGGTTIAPTLQQGVERERAGGLGRLDEIIRQQQVNTFTTLSGDEFGARQDQLGQGTNLGFNVLGAQGNIAGRGFDVTNQNFLTNVSQVYDIEGRGAIMTQGQEGHVLAVVGGTGDFSNVRGEGIQVFVQDPPLTNFDFTIPFDLKGAGR